LPSRLFCAAALALIGGLLPSSRTPQAQAPERAPCAAPEYRQFDFWIGDWDAFELKAPGKVVARNRVDSILGGCVLREVYEQGDGLTGQSFTIYDATRKVWHQSWVTNRGQLLVIEGGMQGDRMVSVLDGQQILRQGADAGESFRPYAGRQVDPVPGFTPDVGALY